MTDFSGTSAPAEQKPEKIRQGTNVLATISLLLALTASPLTVIFGYIAVGQVRRANQRGEGMAWFAIGLGWLWLVAWIVLGISAAVIWFDL
jgi:uncharacterized membrane protein